MTHMDGVFIYESEQGKIFTVKKFEVDDIKKMETNGDFSERDFWCEQNRVVYYGSDIPSQSEQMTVLNDSRIYKHIPEAKDENILGICTPYIYIGQRGSFFPLHKVTITISSNVVRLSTSYYSC